MDFPLLSPSVLFELQWHCPQIEANPLSTLWKRLKNSCYRLPSVAALCDEEEFAQLYAGWSPEGFAFGMDCREPHRRSLYPAFMRGDSLELFLDTRDLKSAKWNTRFCHHFFGLAEAVDGHRAGEVTQFRSSDQLRQLADDQLIQVLSHLHPDSYQLLLWLPKELLVGYDPEQFARIGFSYRVNRALGAPQHFSARGDEYCLEQQPSSWASFQLIAKAC